VIASKSVDEFVPLSRAADGTITTQFTMTTLEELGLLKMDFLGLRTLTVIQNAQHLIQQNTGVLPDMMKIDFNDPKVMGMIGAGKCEGVFQLESAGMKSFMKELKPTSLDDIVAGVALYRPGPMDFIPQYIKGKKNADTVQYECEELRPILESTYGCIVYQEQVMQIVRDLAGYTYGQSDVLRRAMSKKKAAVMAEERKNFVYGNAKQNVPGCIRKGIPEKVANKIYDEMTDFARYAFNKSHAAAYAIVSYQTAWLKYYYPVEFMAALMTSVIDNPGKVAEYILHCRKIGIQILPPDINSSVGAFSVDDDKIRYGLSAVKGIGRPVMNVIVNERETHGKYEGLQDFCERLSGKEVNKRTIENFIKAGAFDSFGGTRKQYMQVYGQVLDQVNKKKKNSMDGQMSIFDLMSPEMKKNYDIQLPPVGEFDDEEKLALEKEVTGVYIGGHPLQKYEDKLRKNTTNSSMDFQLNEETGTSLVRDDQRAVIGGMITEKTIKYTRNNKVMAFLTLEDLLGTVEIVAFPKDYERYQKVLEEDAKIFVRGRVSCEDDKPSKLILEKVVPFEKVPAQVWIQFDDLAEYNDRKAALAKMLSDKEGPDEVVIYLKKEKQIKKAAGRGVQAEGSLPLQLMELFGASNVKVVERALKNL